MEVLRPPRPGPGGRSPSQGPGQEEGVKTKEKRISGHRSNYPALVGVYLMANALPDSIVVVDGPDCALYKAHYIHGRHDLNSTLLDINGFHRICFTNVCAQSVTKDHNELILRKLHMIDKLDSARVVLLTSLPGCFITGLDYEHLMRSASHFMRQEVFALPPAALVGDWIDGYGIAMRGVARHMKLRQGKGKRDQVAIVGYLMDRNEGDHRGNQIELKRMLAALGLDLVSVWLDGQPYDSLKRVEEAGVIISLPYGRGAAEELAKKTGARLVEADLPFGLGYCADFLRRIAAATGREERAEAFILAEEAEAFRRLEWLTPYLFLHKKAAFLGDPFLLNGFLDVCEDLGITPAECFVMGRENRFGFKPRKGAPPVVFEPDIYHEAVNRFIGKPPDLIVTNTNDMVREIKSPTKAILELGFPSYTHHNLGNTPFLGYQGFLCFADRIAEHLFYQRRVMTKQEGRWAEGDWDKLAAGPAGEYTVPHEALKQ
ncbi:MAG: hypothetical protein A2X36_10855 [Elusimicrobia bacterium GWA2_69_24]|nr:MAG: hypothetical protein A2X36_10855 [Elusimicrobia bacterium GWA2_69_24]